MLLWRFYPDLSGGISDAAEHDAVEVVVRLPVEAVDAAAGRRLVAERTHSKAGLKDDN